MRIVIDLQGAQTESRFRGIGRYSLSLAQAIARNRGNHEVVIALNALFPETIEPIRNAFDGLLPQENIRVWHAVGPVLECRPGNERRREAAEKMREAFLASLEPDIVYVTSIFEGFVDDAVTSVGAFSTAFPTVVTLYDLIPLLNPEKYFTPHPMYEKHYRRKLEFFKRATGYVAISDFSAKEGVRVLQLPEDAVTNISTACSPMFTKKTVDPESLFSRLGITKKFILNTGGADERKNLPRLIEAFASLPASLRERYQLVLAGKFPEAIRFTLSNLAQKKGIPCEGCIFTGYIPDDDLVTLYTSCSLFVFPSWHEGFGIPPLEAMSCGAPVIAANSSSLPEVMGWQDALFDPMEVPSIAGKMQQALVDGMFRNQLIENAARQANNFSWDESAKKAIAAFQAYRDRFVEQEAQSSLQTRKRKLAYVSPLPPEKTGIADYSAELLPALSKFYDIILIIEQSEVGTPWLLSHCEVRDSAWLRENYLSVDRVLYHMGNSPFHTYMLSLLNDIPGVVVLHDFFLSALHAFCELQNLHPYFWTKELYRSHGYHAVQERFSAPSLEDVIYKYPSNFSVLADALGVLVHSQYSLQIFSQWYGTIQGLPFELIPFLRTPPSKKDKQTSRNFLGIPQDAFLVCSFGMLDSTKLNHALVNAWKNSSLRMNPHAFLVFVGQNHAGDYGAQLSNSITEDAMAGRVQITGWVSMEEYHHYLASADVAVQLRTRSRGETSAAVHDCLNYGIPTIVNANGSFRFLDPKTVKMIPDNFQENELVEALEKLCESESERNLLSMEALRIMCMTHSPSRCAELYHIFIEHTYKKALGSQRLLSSLVDGLQSLTKNECIQLSKAVALNHPVRNSAKQLFVDISATHRSDRKTGIERVVRSLLLNFLALPPLGYRVEPVYLTNEGGRWHYRYARRYTMRLLECPPDILKDDVAEYHNGDMLLCVDLSGSLLVDASREGLLREMKNQGVQLFSMVHDILPLTMPRFFPEGSDKMHLDWLTTVLEMNGCICVSKSVADELSWWIAQNAPSKSIPFRIEWSHHGADIDTSAPSTGLPPDAEDVLAAISKTPSFLMVGTIEPRKGHLQTIEAFTGLWEAGEDINLIIVGKEGWKDLPQEMRRTIPEIVSRLKNHPERGKRLFWLEGISDEYLEKVYEASTCLIFASEGEGFGLPLIEAAKHGLPIIARDIPVFREVAGEHAYYFLGKEPSDLVAAVKRWITLYNQKAHPKSTAMPWLTWRESAERIKTILIPKEKAI